MSESWAIRDLERRVDKLDDRTEDLIAFIDWGWDLPEPDLGPLPVESDMAASTESPHCPGISFHASLM
jgi:hypothetical protein